MENIRIKEESSYMTVNDVRRFLNISLSAAYDLAHSRDFPVCRFGGNIRIPRTAFLLWVESRTFIPTKLADVNAG